MTFPGQWFLCSRYVFEEEPLNDILPVEVHIGEIIEIDDGLQPYFSYVLNSSTVVLLPYFHLTKGVNGK